VGSGFPAVGNHTISHLHLYITDNISNTPLGVHRKDKHHDARFRTINFGGVYEFEFTPTPTFKDTMEQ
jgi:hypothetical protein